MTSVTYPDLKGKVVLITGSSKARRPRASLLPPGRGSSSTDAMNRRLSGSPVQSALRVESAIGIRCGCDPLSAAFAIAAMTRRQMAPLRTCR